MYSNKHLAILFLLAAFFLFNKGLLAQDAADTINDNVHVKGKYALVLYGGGGPFYYLPSVGASGTGINTGIDRMHSAGTFRIMWHPDHRLRVGLESGYVDFYSYQVQNGDTIGKVKVSGIPIFLIWSMAITKRINVFAGMGYYQMNTQLDYAGKVSSKAFALGVSAAVNYVQPISPKLGIGAEIKFIDATQTKDYGLSAQVMLVWKFFEW